MRKVDRNALREHALPPLEGGSKETRGRFLVVGGHRNVPGAVLLAAEAALRAGAGRLQIGVPPELAIPIGVACPEALTTSFDEVPTLLHDVDAIALGVGTFATPGFTHLCASIARESSAALAVDAGAFAVLGENEELLRNRSGAAVLTPHYGELARLLGRAREEVEREPADATMEAARRFGCVVAGKGARSFIASPDGACYEHDGGTVALAVSGSGDVLSGILGGFLARGADALSATLWAVAVHGEIGRRLEERIGTGLLARELAVLVPSVLREWSD